MDIKNALEMLTLAKEAAAQAKEIMADGKVNLLDLPKLAPLFGPARDALEGAENVVAELKDVDAEEAKVLAAAAIDVAVAWASVFPKAA